MIYALVTAMLPRQTKLGLNSPVSGQSAKYRPRVNDTSHAAMVSVTTFLILTSQILALKLRNFAWKSVGYFCRICNRELVVVSLPDSNFLLVQVVAFKLHSLRDAADLSPIIGRIPLYRDIVVFKGNRCNFHDTFFGLLQLAGPLEKPPRTTESAHTLLVLLAGSWESLFDSDCFPVLDNDFPVQLLREISANILTELGFLARSVFNCALILQSSLYFP